MLNINYANIYKNYESEETIRHFSKIIEQKNPLFISRIGGFDYNVVVKYFNNNKYYNAPSLHNTLTTIVNTLYQMIRGSSDYGIYNNYLSALTNMKTITGFFDFDNQHKNFIHFLDKMITFYKNSNYFMFGGKELIDKFNTNIFGSNLHFLNYILEDKTAFHYGFLDAVLPFLESFRVWGENKKILIISPFAKSLEFQYQRKNKLLRNYTFPNFDLLTYNTPVTYNGSGDTKESLHVETNNWHEQCDKMNREISQIDFDIAWLSCASYAMSVGDHIKEQMGRKAIYIGGILNVIFNIYGGRYNTPYYNGIVDLNYQIDAFENETIKNVQGGRSSHSESLYAYFGTRKI